MPIIAVAAPAVVVCTVLVAVVDGSSVTLISPYNMTLS